MMIRVQIRNYESPKCSRIFDVVINEDGDILRYEFQNIKGFVSVSEAEVRRQINNFLKTRY